MDVLLCLGKVRILNKYLTIIPVIGLAVTLTDRPVLAADISITVKRQSDTIQLTKVSIPASTWESRQKPLKFSWNCAPPKFDPAKQPLYILNGKEIDPTSMRKINPGNIKSFTVLKDQAEIATYGEKAKYGVFLISTKKK